MPDRKSQVARCPACGQPLVTLDRGRCPLCAYEIDDASVTGDDVSPYAEALHAGKRGWWAMCRWIGGAGAGRLSHLALMRASSESRRFLTINLLLVTIAMTLCAIALSGWHGVKVIDHVSADVPVEPTGKAWLPVVTSPRSVASRPVAAVAAWWWNPMQAAATGGVVFFASLILGALCMSMLRAGIERSLGARYGGQQRLAAAVHYSSAFALPLIPAALILALLPVSRIAPVAEWPIQPAPSMVLVPAGVVAAIGVLGWWFCITRLALTVPVRVRTRLILFCSMWMPLIAAGLVALAGWGWLQLRDQLMTAWQLQW